MPINDPFSNFTGSSGLSSPARSAFAITPNDSADLATLPRAIFVGSGGSLVVIAADDSASVTLQNVPSGFVLSLRCKRVLATGTGATGLIGLY